MLRRLGKAIVNLRTIPPRIPTMFARLEQPYGRPLRVRWSTDKHFKIAAGYLTEEVLIDLLKVAFTGTPFVHPDVSDFSHVTTPPIFSLPLHLATLCTSPLPRTPYLRVFVLVPVSLIVTGLCIAPNACLIHVHFVHSNSAFLRERTCV